MPLLCLRCVRCQEVLCVLLQFFIMGAIFGRGGAWGSKVGECIFLYIKRKKKVAPSLSCYEREGATAF